MPDELIRELDPSEARFVPHGAYSGHTVLVTGELDATALGAAFAALQRSYPVLTCRIVEESDGRCLLVRSNASPPVGPWFGDGDPGRLRDPAQPLDPATQLAYLDVVAAPGCARVTWYIHHAVADGSHAIELFARFWDFYTDCLTATVPEPVPHDYPRSLEWYSATYGFRRGPLSGLEDVTVPLSAEPKPDPAAATAILGGGLLRPARSTLDAETTGRLIALARRTGLTVNSVVTGVLLRAFGARTSADPRPVRALYAVDLRRHLDPQVPATAGTNLAASACFAADMETCGGTMELARRIAGRLRRDLAQGVLQQSVWHYPDFYGDRRTRSVAGHLGLTNCGVIPRFRTPPGAAITDYEIVHLLAHPRPSTEVTSQTGLFMLYTFAGRLTIGYVGAVDADVLLAVIRDELTAISAEEPVIR
ncbi:phthiocerol/phthiodiolone dimycocerosyl transferase family protein [Nocardia arthritidis]|uniref:Phthiocerol/phthiodiolone dimycocerosyl transferase n=1 Tax=Nocardia arthritidis TaxID=228602 RepID=A0A6G9YG86_9NOCA|nr:acyltransferase [Nocardia arthritidis]QIS12150.1 acyltransferase [Nocardia arthritidis]